MKKILASLLAGVALFSLAATPVLADNFAVYFDWNDTTGDDTIPVYPSTVAGQLFGTDPTTLQPVAYSMDPTIEINHTGRYIAVAQLPISRTDGLQEALNAKVSATTLSAATTSLNNSINNIASQAYGGATTTFNSRIHNWMNASTSLYLASSTANGFMSSGDKTKLSEIPVIQRTTGTTNGSGDYTFTFPASFSATPIISVVAEDNTSGALTNVQVTSVSTTAVTVHANRLTTVLGILTLATTPQVTVHITAVAQ